MTSIALYVRRCKPADLSVIFVPEHLKVLKYFKKNQK